MISDVDSLADQDPLNDSELRMAVYHVMTVLYRSGIGEIHLGGLMRILGVDNEAAAIHDQEIVIMNDQAAEFVESLLDQYQEHQDAQAADTQSDEADQEVNQPKVTIH